MKDGDSISQAAPRAREGPFFLSFVQPAIDRAFPGVPTVRAPAQEQIFRGALRKAAEAGDAAAQLRLGFIHDEGLGVPLDRREARAWYRKAAEQGDARAALCLGRIYYFGQDVEPDYREAARWYRLAADRGEAAALANLGYMHAHGLGVSCDYGLAFRLLLRGAERGDSKAQSNLGLIYFHRHDSAESIRWHRAAADQGNGPSMCNLGHIYSIGAGVGRDMAEAAKWYALGALYRKEQSNDRLEALIPRVSASEWEKVVRECRRSAAAGVPRMQLLLGALYYEGLGVSHDVDAAFKWLKLSAKQGNTKGQWRLGYMYYTGTGISRDYSKAFPLFWQAAWKNDTHSQIMVGESYRYGRGVRQDIKEAAKWYRRVAERGSPPAQMKLAKLLETGRGVRRDLRQAALWSLLASAQGAGGAVARWEDLSRGLTSAETLAVRGEAVMRWPALSWKTPIPALRLLLRTVNAALPIGQPTLTENALELFWTPSAWADPDAAKPRQLR